jgi:alpha-glucosidase (family GH31 glycosyl hydrolase)
MGALLLLLLLAVAQGGGPVVVAAQASSRLTVDPSAPGLQSIEPNPVPNSDSIVTFGSARFTVLSQSLIRMQSTGGRPPLSFDDRASSVVINRRLALAVPFAVAHPNATAVTITTAKLRLTYSLPPPPLPPPKTPVPAVASGCSCVDEKECADPSLNISWQIRPNHQGADGKRTPGCPNGLVNQTLESCFCACTADPDCEGLTYAPAGKDLALSCWLLTGVSKLMSVGDRVFVGALNGGPSKGFDASNLLIELLDPAAPIKTWRPSADASQNLNGSYTNLDCYTVPAKCVAQNIDKLQKGLLSRDGWALWDDINSPRFTASNSSAFAKWHEKNHRTGADADLYFFGHGLRFKDALRDFVQLSGPPGLLSAPDYGLWWSNSFVFTKEQFLDRLIANFTKHKLPFTHLVMDFGWHQRQNATASGGNTRLWASYTWNRTLFGDTADVQDFVQSLHSNAKSSPLGRSMSLSLNVHPIGVQPTELRYKEFERQIGADPSLNQTLACQLGNETWMTALFDQVLDAEPNSGVDSWWTDGTCDGGTYGGSWENQYAFSERIRENRELRGYVMSRWGGVGSQRSPMGFSGDQTTAWPTLQFQVESTPLASNVGFNAWSHDIGGFDCCGGEQGGIYGQCPFPAWQGCETNSSTDTGSQLLVRWLQHGALSAVDRTHCGGCNREFWTFPNFPAMKDAMDFRISLFPYLYSENHRTRTSGISLLHPIYYDAPELEESYAFPGEYFFGPSMLVQPIVEPIPPGEETLTLSTWLPPGKWTSWNGAVSHLSGQAGGSTVSEAYAVHSLPIFVRAGSVVPLRTTTSLTRTVAFSDPLVWAVWPGLDSASASMATTQAAVAGGNATVIEDDGATLRYQDGHLASTTMHWRRADAQTLVLSVGATVGDFDVGCSAEDGFEYAGAGAELIDIGTVASHSACCDACGLYSNCAFWTFEKTARRCALKVSRKGRRANTTTVSGLAPRLMPTQRVHFFQLRTPHFATKPPSRVTVNGEVLQKVPAGSDEAGWYVQGKPTVPSLTVGVEGSLVIATASLLLNQAVEVHVTLQ